MKSYLKNLCIWVLVLTMILPGPMTIFAQEDQPYPYSYENLTKDKDKIINGKDVNPAKTDKAEDLIKNPKQPAIYTLRTDYKVQRGDKYVVDYQPYIASVGEAATQAEKDKVNQTVKLPDLTGYEKPDDDYLITYDKVKEAAENKGKTGNDINGFRYQANEDFRYKAKANEITIKHVFQDLHDFSKYTNPDGSVGETGELITTQNGNTGSTMEVSPLGDNHPNRKGFVPEAPFITMQVPENAENFILEYRYNRAHYDVTFDTAGGTALPARTLYYGQAIPKIADADIPTKVGGIFQGWKPSVDIKTKDGKTFKANEIIKVGTGQASNNLDANLIMPASKVTFTAVWKDKEKADYAIQFWAEKADHADDAGLLDKYEYMGTRVYKDQDTGSRPDLNNVSVKDIVFPDLDQARLNKIWAGARFNRGKDLYLNKFYVYNQALTADQNKDPANVNLVKSVDSTGKTVYNIFYDRQVYDLYFTKSNALPEKNSFYPEIWGYDTKKGESVMLGGPGKPYHYKARFNEMMYKWPNDAKQTKGFTPGYQSFGWGPNYTTPNWPTHLDTPPYRLNADEFLDMANYTNWGGYTKNIDKGDGTSIDLKWFDFKTLSFGIKQDSPSIPHHMDFWMDGFKKDETIIRYDLVRTKADTAAPGYGHRYPRVQGFTPRDYNPTNPQSAWPVIHEGSEENGRVTEDEINDLNDERNEITPNNSGTYYNNQGIKLPIGQLSFISAFFSDSDDFGDVKDGGQKFKENGYLRFKYTRNKYPLRFNYDPSIIRDDSYFNSKNQLDTFYEFPLKTLSPDVDDNNEYKKVNTKEGPKNLLDNPENLQKLGLTDLVFTDPKDNKLKVKRPEGLSDQMVFKGWALDPAGTKLIWENPKETMPFHPVHLFAKWGEPDYKWKVTFDPDGGKLKTIKEDRLTTDRKTIQEGDIGQEEVNTYAKKEDNDGDKQVFTVIQRQKLVEPNFKPERKGYDFMGWEVIRYKKNDKGDYTDEIDNSYRDTYKVPELYSFGNDVVSPIYLKAIWVPNQRVDIKIEHYMLDKDYKLKEKLEDTLEDKRANYLVATTGDKQDDEYILAPHEELEEKLTGDLKTTYEEYNKRVGLNNSFFQTFRVEPAKIPGPNDSSKTIDNPKVEDNVFKFFYRPFRLREYTVNYLDEKGKAEVEKFYKELELTPTDGLTGKDLLEANQANKEKVEAKKTELDKILKKYQVVGPELVINGNRHYDARNYRQIPGWKLTSDPQQQLFFDLNEDTNDFLGINGTGGDQIFFYYKDVRVIEVPGDKEPPEGYVRVTFKADKGGSFTDKDEKSVTELHYDVIKGLKSDLLPVPKELKDGEEKAEGKYYVTPDDGKKFTKWDNRVLLNKNTIINDNYTFTAYFEWSGLSAKGLVTTESFKDDNGKWINNFAPTIAKLKEQLVWKEKDEVKSLPADATVKIVDETGKELTDQDVYNLVNEKKAADKDQLVRTVNFKAVVSFKDGKNTEELDIPVTVYKNVYEALNKEGHKPLFLKEAEGKEAKDGGLKDVTGNYVKVTIKASKDFNAKDDKIYYVNPKAWVEIPEVKTEGSSTFVNWTADKDAQNENGIFDFAKRHMFTEDTVISPSNAQDVVEQKQGEDKPKVPDNYVEVIVKTTDKATDATAFEKTFWVNPTKEVPIEVTNPTGKIVAADPAKVGAVGYTMNFSKWETEDKARTWTDKILGKFENDTTIIAKYSVTPEKVKDQVPTTDTVHTPQGKTPTADEIKTKITPPGGKTIKEIKIVENPDVTNPGESKVKVIVEYTDGSSVGTNDKPVEIPVEVHKNIIPEAPGGQRPKDAMDNYVKVIFKAGTGGSLSGNLVYYVSPEVQVDMTESAGKITKTPSVGYTSNGGTWSPEIKAEKITAEKTYEFNFVKSKDIVEKTDDPNQVIPEGYVKVTFRADANGTLEEGKTEKIYFVNPKADIKLVELSGDQTAGEKELAVPKTLPAENYVFDKWYEEIDTTNSITSERIHVAKFLAGQVSLTYEAGGAEGTVPEKVTANYGTSVSLARPDKLTKTNATFAGWKLDEDDKLYQPGDQVKLEKARTATAQWTTAKHTVTFNSMGGSDVPKQVVDHGNTATTPEAPTLEGKVFMGWKEKETDTSYFNFKTSITEDKILMAIWQDSVQKIDGNATVEDQFIKVTFQEGKHGKLKLADAEQEKPVTYKVAKDYDFDKAVQAGLVVPEIAPAKYYKAKADNQGWDTELKLAETNAVFTAQYEPQADVIPVDPQVTDEDKIKEEKPEGMVLVEFVVDDKEAYMDGVTKYYVKKDTEVEVPSPLVFNKVENHNFKGWMFNNETTMKIKGSFHEDTKISDKLLEKPKIYVKVPSSGVDFIKIEDMTAGTKGKLEVISKGKTTAYEDTVITKKVRQGRKFVKQDMHGFSLKEALKQGDIIKFWATNENGSSEVYKYIVQ